MSSVHERFLEERRAGRFVVPSCETCGRTHWHPRSHCPACGSPSIALVEPALPARVYTYTVNRRPRRSGDAEGGDHGATAMIGYVEFEDGIRILANLDRIDPRHAIGSAVRPEARRVGEETLFVFVPASDC
ncbi:Zn-ribbon domain-containing OB-fold protein [Microbacterium sp. PA5]|uniref:Zn-ribbon domain-containing OB-fold protein n=1 Tax=Microbacterium sp. PA5 TaxID=3416654 RepID=UPI003CEB907D